MCTTTKLEKLKDLFLTLQVKFDLYEYKFELHNKKRSLGTCNWGDKIIYLSKHFLEVAPLEILEHTIRHEFAHALDARERGFSDHGKNWKKWCSVTGCDAERTVTLPKAHTPKPKYSLVCETHGELAGFHRQPKRSFRCKSCQTALKIQKNF